MGRSRRLGLSAVLAVAALVCAPAASAKPVQFSSTKVTPVETSSSVTLPNPHVVFEVHAIGEDGSEQRVFADFSIAEHPVVRDADGNATNYRLVYFQDFRFHLVPRDPGDRFVSLAQGVFHDVDRNSSTGAVPIPEGYVYNLSVREHPGYHDYCTKAPNFFTTPELDADFRGACARHDMCMDAADQVSGGYGPCNDALLVDMNRVCTSVYEHEYTYYLEPCLLTAQLYHATVNVAQAHNL